jgi:hypothetical protein
MKRILKISFCLLITSLSYHCSDKYELPASLEIHDFVWKGMNAYYLHQDEVADLSDRRFNSDAEVNSFLGAFAEPVGLFTNLKLTSDIKSLFIDDYTTLEDIPLRTGFTNGLEFGIIADPGNMDNVIGYVSHILPNSDASTKNLLRGEFFNLVDGEQLTKTNFRDLLVNGLDSFTISMIDFDGMVIIPNTKTVDLVKLTYSYEAISIQKTFSLSSNVGYLMYNNDFSPNYIPALNNAFLDFKNQSVTELIIDLRYNIGGGGSVENISQIASMITGQFSLPNAREVLLKEQWNTKAQPWFEVNQPDSLLTYFPEKLDISTPINGLNLTDVYIILNGNNYTGSSATELLINSLKSHINVHVIGNQTAGNNTGAITLYNSIDYDFIGRSENHMVAIQPIVLRFLNKDDQTYDTGIMPSLTLCPQEDILDLGVLGEQSDPLLAKTLNYINTGAPGTSGACNPLAFEFLYNSISTQRSTDLGMIIKQNLPNTN